MQKPDYDTYTEAQLRQVLRRIDAVNYPERVQEIEARLAAMPAVEPGAMADDTSPLVIAGFWRRLGAFVIDMLVLALIGYIAGLFFHTQFSAMGEWGRAVGFGVTLAYFGSLESRGGRGGSLGKRVLGLRVVTRDGALLSPAVACARAGIFCAVYFLNGTSLGLSGRSESQMFVTAFLFGGILLGMAYLLVFNRRTRQSLHDLAVGAFVVRGGASAFDTPPLPVWRGHLAILAVLLVTMITAGSLLKKNETMAGLLKAYEAIDALPHVVTVNVNANATFSGDTTTQHLSIRAVVDASVTDTEAVATRIVQTALDNYPDANRQDGIIVTISQGYDIGIASFWRLESFAHTPEEWHALSDKRAVQAMPVR